ncbi:MAG: RpiB/LacA/LacB family sugar-phosphate isomerase [Planctomycetota bacterium]|jgi:ribose 5-phosphate isomerase B|nr:RpiB/LacA/LacB family sugar-phosphate isomerase [Planctomycetota bacterium]
MEGSKRAAIGSDHAALEAKGKVAEHLRKLGWEVVDFTVLVDGRADYPVAGRKVALAVAEGGYRIGVLLCGTGLGMSYVANRVGGVRAALCLNSEFAALSREHNDANVLVMPGRATIYEPHEKILDVWLNTPFSGDERHARRIRMIDDPDAK